MRFKRVLSIGYVSALLAAPAVAGVFTVTTPVPGNDLFNTTIVNDDGFDLTKITFDLTGTSGGLVFGNSGITSQIIGSVTSATPFGAFPDLTFGFDFVGFETGESFSFTWDPDIAGNTGYIAVVPEAAGTFLTLVTSGGTVTGTMTCLGCTTPETGTLSATIESPTNGRVPEPATLALLGLGLAGLGLSRRRKLG